MTSDEDGSSVDDFALGEGASSLGSTCVGRKVPIVFKKRHKDGKLKCKLCSALCTSKSPLTGAHANDEWGGWRPWAKYGKEKDGDGNTIGKFPTARVCLPCWNVYYSLGSISAASSNNRNPPAIL